MAESPLSSLALYTARPTVRINGAEKDRVTGLMRDMEMTEQEDGLSTLELRLENIASDGSGSADFAFEDEAQFKLGDPITVSCGEESDPTEIFRGIISALEAEFSKEGTPCLVALAEDTLQKARIKRRTRTHENKTIADIARTIASDLGLTPQINGMTQSIGTQVQLNESDLAFLRRLLARYDGDVQVVAGELHVAPRGQVRRGLVELALHSQLRSVTVLADLAHQVNKVTVTGWDAARGQRINGESQGSHQGPGTGRSGSSLLSNALGSRNHQIGHLAVNTDDEARALADAAFDERQRRFVTVNGTAEGNPAIRVGTHVKLTGLGPRFSNTYYVTRCCHHFDLQRGYETQFNAESAFLGQP
ncbi:MAG TPA: contractile injection system protein, VgrG/Pvc8 family [Terriglobia bacterium]|nr:contractile injection system protein, VgrG/Pvc8 family [Terriglobia bacterium]